MTFEGMSPEEAQRQLELIGRNIRTSEAPDSEVMQAVIMEIIHGIGLHGLKLNSQQLAEMIAKALVDMGGYHRIGSC